MDSKKNKKLQSVVRKKENYNGSMIWCVQQSFFFFFFDKQRFLTHHFGVC